LAKTLQTLLHALPHYQVNGYGMLKLPIFTPEKTINKNNTTTPAAGARFVFR